MEELLTSKKRLLEDIDEIDKKIKKLKEEEVKIKEYNYQFQNQFDHEEFDKLFLNKDYTLTNKFSHINYDYQFTEGDVCLLSNFCNCDVYGPCGHGPSKKLNTKITCHTLKYMLENSKTKLKYKIESCPGKRFKVIITIDSHGDYRNFHKSFQDKEKFYAESTEIISEPYLILYQI